MLLFTPMFAGKHDKHVSLAYIRPESTVCCSAGYLFVAEHTPSVHLYSLTGVHIQTLSYQQLDLGENDCIHAIQCNHDGTVLQLAIGDRSAVRSLHAYKVRCTFILSHTIHGYIVR